MSILPRRVAAKSFDAAAEARLLKGRRDSAEATMAAARGEPDKPLPPIDADPEFARLAQLRRTLSAARHAREAAIEAAALEGDLRRNATGPRADRARERLARLRTAAPAAPAPPPGDGTPPELAAALRLLAGEAVRPEPDRMAHLARLRDEIAIIGTASAWVSATMDERRGDLSVAAAQRLLRQHRSILVTIHEAAVALAAAVDAERRLYASVLIAGYEERPDILNRPALTGAARLGSTSEYDSQISEFTRRLQFLGVIT